MVLQVPLKIGQNKNSTSLPVTIPSGVFTFTSYDCKNPSLDIVHARLGHTVASKI